MTVKTNFEQIRFFEHLGDKIGDLTTFATFVGTQTTVRNFVIDGRPVDNGYLIIQTYDVDSRRHEILINGQPLRGFDLPDKPTAKKWQTWMDIIETGFLRQGNNTIQIRSGSHRDNFIIDNVVINWKEDVQ